MTDEFIKELLGIDHELFLKAKGQPCRKCGKPLDTSSYTRKTRGFGPGPHPRFSLCCRKNGCRSRVRPPHLRFLGRKVFSPWVIILVHEFGDRLGLDSKISRQTLNRWRNWWRDLLAFGHPFMQSVRNQLPVDLPACELPGVILGAFGFPDRKSWVPILKFFCENPLII